MKPFLFKLYTNGICVEEKWFKLIVLEYGSNQCLIPKKMDAKMPDTKMLDTKFISFMLVQFTAP